MSCLFDLSLLSKEKKEEFSKELEVCPKETKYGKTEPILCFDVFEIGSKNYISLPFSYYLKNISTDEDDFPNEDKEFSRTNYEFKGNLNHIQTEIKKETFDILNKNRSILISLYCGAGKCLHGDTRVLLYGTSNYKKAKDINVGDILIGDDNKSRTVLSVCRGVETMYKIVPKYGKSYTVNSSHILSLICPFHKKYKFLSKRGEYILYIFDKQNLSLKNYRFSVNNSSREKTYRKLYEFKNTFSDEDCKVDIEVYKYINLSDRDKSYLYGYNKGIEYKEKKINIDVYNEGFNLCFKDDYTINSKNIRLQFLAGVIDRLSILYNGRYTINSLSNDIMEKIKYLCLSLSLSVRVVGKNIQVYGNIAVDIPSRVFKDYNWNLYRNRDRNIYKIKVKDIGVGEYYGFEIDGNRRFLIEDFTVTHNTIFSIFLSSKIKYKTVVLCHRINLIDQWVYSISKVCPDAKIQVCGGKTNIDKNCDFVIMNVANVCKKSIDDFKDIGLLIVDEAHTICTENMSQSLFYFYPKYVIFLTATPDRTDGKGKILDLYVGENRIQRKLWRPFNVYVVDTGFKPEIKQNKTGMIDWNGVLQSQALDEDRNDLIVQIIRYFSCRNFLVLCKRVEQGNILKKILLQYDEEVDVFTGSSKKFNRDSRILISTYSKSGVGFDHPKLDTLIIASDVEEGIEQYVGRVFRREDVVPIVFDLLDKMHTMYKHFLTRRNLYSSIGGDIKKFEKYFPEFYE